MDKNKFEDIGVILKYWYSIEILVNSVLFTYQNGPRSKRKRFLWWRGKPNKNFHENYITFNDFGIVVVVASTTVVAAAVDIAMVVIAVAVDVAIAEAAVAVSVTFATVFFTFFS